MSCGVGHFFGSRSQRVAERRWFQKAQGRLIQHIPWRFARDYIPLPPLAEQTRIVAEVERRLSVVEELEAAVSANLQRATRLRQSILQKAFTGELIMISPEFLAENSSYIENLMRHRFVYDVSRLLLLRQEPELVTVLTAEVDDAGVDLVLSFRDITRQIQMKTLAKQTAGNPYAIAESLSSIVGGCVVWMCYDRETLVPTMYHLMAGRGNGLIRNLSSSLKQRKTRSRERFRDPGTGASKSKTPLIAV